MAGTHVLSDEQIASLLADTKKRSIKKSSVTRVGISAFSKSAFNKPKPNTRFLRNMIQETDNHNAALLAKEAKEAKNRLDNLSKTDTSSPSYIRGRQHGHIADHWTGRAKIHYRFKDDDEAVFGDDKNKINDRLGERQKNETRTRKEDREGLSFNRGSHKRRRSLSEERGGKRGHDDDKASGAQNASRHQNSRERKREASQRSSAKRNKTENGSRLSQRRQYSPEPESKRDKLRTNKRKESNDEHRRSGRGQHPWIRRPEPDDSRQPISKSHGKSSSRDSGKDEDSDPLESIIGPLPPRAPRVISRGRGTISSGSGMDVHFSRGYDPSADIAPLSEPDGDTDGDWDLALEALHDRQRWREQGAERLRAAGFTDGMISRWEKSGKKGMGEKEVSDVKWAKRGERREWDKGKVFSADGDDETAMNVDVNFGRLKGT